MTSGHLAGERKILREKEELRAATVLWPKLPRTLDFWSKTLQNQGPHSFGPDLMAHSLIVRSPAPVKPRQSDHPYSKLLQNCVALISLSCRDFTGAGGWTIKDRALAQFPGLFPYKMRKKTDLLYTFCESHGSISNAVHIWWKLLCIPRKVLAATKLSNRAPVSITGSYSKLIYLKDCQKKKKIKVETGSVPPPPLPEGIVVMCV